MGDRYFSRKHLNWACWLWGPATAFALKFDMVRSPLAFFINEFRHPHIVATLLSIKITIGVAVALCAGLGYWGFQDILQMQRYRQDCIAYHSRSRGASRWGAANGLIGAFIILTLGLFDFPVCVLFVISQFMAGKIADEQDAAIYSRYLDMLDQQVEKEYLEKAVLGQCPTEITQLTHPLPSAMKQEYRQNVAAAAVNKPVKIVARPPQSKNETGAKPPAADTPASDFPYAKTSNNLLQPVLGFLSSKKFKRVSMLVIVMTVAGFGVVFAAKQIIYHWPAHASKANAATPVMATPNNSKATPIQEAPTTQAAIVNSPKASSIVQVATAPEKPVSPQVVPDPPASTPPVQVPIISATIPTARPVAVTAISTTKLAAAIDALNTFSNYCYGAIAADNERIKQIKNENVRAILVVQSSRIRNAVDQMIGHRELYLGSLTNSADDEASLVRSTPNLIVPRDSVTNALSSLNVEIDNAKNAH